MNPGNYWNLNPTANFAGFPYEQAQNVRRWSIPTYDEDQASTSHVPGLIFQRTVQEPCFHSAAEPAQNQAGKAGKGKGSYDKWTNEEQDYLVDLWAEKHDRLESKDARKVWLEISEELELNFGTKKPVDKCQRKIKYLLDKYKDAKQWNRNQSGGHIRKSVFYDKIDRVLGTRDVVTLRHVVEAGSRSATSSPNATGPSSDESALATPSPGQSTSGSGASGTSGETPVQNKRRKERKRTTKRKQEDGPADEDAISIKRSLESMEREGEKLSEVMASMQQTQSRQLDMMTTFMGSLIEAIKDKR